MAPQLAVPPRAAAALSQLAADADLLRRARAGDYDAAGQLVRCHGSALFRAARAILLDDGEAEDAVEEAFVHALRGPGGFRGDSSVRAWLVRIAAGEALLRVRARKAPGRCVS